MQNVAHVYLYFRLKVLLKEYPQKKMNATVSQNFRYINYLESQFGSHIENIIFPRSIILYETVYNLSNWI